MALMTVPTSMISDSPRDLRPKSAFIAATKASWRASIASFSFIKSRRRSLSEGGPSRKKAVRWRSRMAASVLSVSAEIILFTGNILPRYKT
jgi:hypothetical protein